MPKRPFIAFQKSGSQAKSPSNAARENASLENVLNEYRGSMQKQSFSNAQSDANDTSETAHFETPVAQHEEHENSKKEDGEEEEDPLDAFMRNLEKSNDGASAHKANVGGVRLEREDHVLDTLDQSTKKRKLNNEVHNEQQHAVDRFLEEIDAQDAVDDPHALLQKSSKNRKVLFKRDVETLPAVDHTTMGYHNFRKCLYRESPEISRMERKHVDSIRRRLEIDVSGSSSSNSSSGGGGGGSGVKVLNPVEQFEQCGFDERMMRTIAEQKFEEPTPIQRQSIPVALNGQDLIALAKTGSGKTLAFVLPMVTHIMAQNELAHGEGPISLIVAPTRELVQQIYGEVKKYARGYGLRVLPIFGGQDKTEQFRALRKGCDVVVAAPGRLVDLIKMKACKLNKVTMVILDEADRMFDMGFERQCRALVDQTRPDRQTLLFSATLNTKIERLVRDILTDPVRVSIGNVGQANRDVTQHVVVLNTNEQKWPWLTSNISSIVERGTVMVFVSQRIGSDELANNLNAAGIPAASIHGEKTQEEREDVITAFKEQVIPVLVATDVAARGLDIPHVKTVINFDTAKDADAHVHRIGRTGRAGDQEGVAYTLVTRKETRFAGQLVQNLEQAKQHVPPELMTLAMTNPRFSKQRKQQGLGMSRSHDKNASGGRSILKGLQSNFILGTTMGGSATISDNYSGNKEQKSEEDVGQQRQKDQPQRSTVEIIQRKNPKAHDPSSTPTSTNNNSSTTAQYARTDAKDQHSPLPSRTHPQAPRPMSNTMGAPFQPYYRQQMPPGGSLPAPQPSQAPMPFQTMPFQPSIPPGYLPPNWQGSTRLPSTNVQQQQQHQHQQHQHQHQHMTHQQYQQFLQWRQQQQQHPFQPPPAPPAPSPPQQPHDREK